MTNGPAPAVPAPAPPRLESVDLLRGLVMVVMALDHTRDYFHTGAMQKFDPLDPAHTTVWLFFTRWITHFCAPLFSFLAGTGVFLAASRGKSKRELSWFLVTRGLWLILLELTYVRWCWLFTVDPHSNHGLVLWALGWAMIGLAVLIHLPLWATAAFGVLMIATHNAFDSVTPESWGSWAWLWRVLHVRGPIAVTPNFTFRVGYPLIPWFGVMAAGYAFGAILRLAPALRRRWLAGLGLGTIGAFVVLRFSNVYGDAHLWSMQERTAGTIASFIDCVKYPPSLCYLLMTLGPGFLLLSWFDRGTPGWMRPLLVYGRVPFLYYMLHIPLIHGLAALLYRIQFGRSDFLGLANPTPAPPGAGLSLWLVYLIWLAVVVSLYPVCRWFADLKRRNRSAWLSYF